MAFQKEIPKDSNEEINMEVSTELHIQYLEGRLKDAFDMIYDMQKQIKQSAKKEK